MNKSATRISSFCLLFTGSLALTGCETMTHNPGMSAAGTGLATVAVCKLVGGSDKECVAAGIASGGLTYAYLRSQLKKLQEIENVEATPCESSDPSRQAYCVTMNSYAVNFNSGSAEIAPDTKQTLNKVADVLRSAPNTLIYIEGHTDSDGSDAANQALSERRASSVQGVFQKHGIGTDRIQAIGFGESQPLHDDLADPTKKPLNRRVEIRVEGGA